MRVRGEIKLYLKRSLELGEKSGVKYMNGTVALGSVKMNVYSFAVDGFLIDTASQSLNNEFAEFIETVDIDQVLLTHDHEDHTGGAAYVQSKLDIPVLIDASRVALSDKRARNPLYRKLFWGERKPFAASPLKKELTSRQAKWDVVATPGHTDDHQVFINRETGQLFSGDLYVHPFPKLALKTESMPQTAQSIRQILNYDFEEMFCCHAGYVKEGRKALEKKLNYLEEIEGQVLKLHKEGQSVKEITQEVFPKKYPLTYISFGEWSQSHIVRSIIK